MEIQALSFDADQTLWGDGIEGEFRGQPHNLEDVRRASSQAIFTSAGCPAPEEAADAMLEIFLEVPFNEIAWHEVVPNDHV